MGKKWEKQDCVSPFGHSLSSHNVFSLERTGARITLPFVCPLFKVLTQTQHSFSPCPFLVLEQRSWSLGGRVRGGCRKEVRLASWRTCHEGVNDGIELRGGVQDHILLAKEIGESGFVEE